jgi:hypothetical protein
MSAFLIPAMPVIGEVTWSAQDELGIRESIRPGDLRLESRHIGACVEQVDLLGRDRGQVRQVVLDGVVQLLLADRSRRQRRNSDVSATSSGSPARGDRPRRATCARDCSSCDFVVSSAARAWLSAI